MDVSSVAQCVVYDAGIVSTFTIGRPQRERSVMPERRQQMMMGKWHYQVINVRPDNRFPDNKPKPQMNAG
jgi:hypothetical protein